MKDIVKCIIGDIVSEAEPQIVEPTVEQIGDSLWLVNGNASTELLATTIGISMDDGESDTFSGYVLGLHGNIPSDGETFEVETERLYIKALEIKEHIVERAEIFVKPEVDGKKEEDSDEE